MGMDAAAAGWEGMGDGGWRMEMGWTMNGERKAMQH